MGARRSQDGHGHIKRAQSVKKAAACIIEAMESRLLLNGQLSFATPVNYVTGPGPACAVAADLNGDGWEDLAVADTGSSTVSVLLNNGDGTFAAKVDYATGNNSNGGRLTAADFDGDGKIDLAVAASAGTAVSVLLNQGGGTFPARTDYPVSGTPESVAAADFNGDGKADLAVAYGNDNVGVMLNKGAAPSTRRWTIR